MTTSARTIRTGHVVVVPDGRVGMVMYRAPRGTTCYVQFVQNSPLLGVDTERLRLASSDEIGRAGLDGVGRLPAPDEVS